MLHAGREVRGVLRVSAVVERAVRQASGADARAIRDLLTAAQLPVEDLDRANVRFWVAGEGSSIVGGIGLERSGAAGLLRSLIVAPSTRRRGIGGALVKALERDAREAGVEEIVLLTQTAEAFFQRSGYGIVDRAAVPEGIRALEEFRSLCPASAVCMAKRLAKTGRNVDG